VHHRYTNQKKNTDKNDVEIDVSLLRLIGAPVEDNSGWHALGLPVDSFDLEYRQ
jgi:hypothetical protein